MEWGGGWDGMRRRVRWDGEEGEVGWEGKWGGMGRRVRWEMGGG